MKLIDFFKFKIYSNKSRYDLSKFDLGINDDDLYLLKTYKLCDMKYVGTYEFNAEKYFCENKNNVKYPENAFKIPIEKGDYVLMIKSGNVVDSKTKMINDTIMTSCGKPSFKSYEQSKKEFKNDNFIHSFEFSINYKKMFSIWTTTKDTTGKIKFSIYSLSKRNESKEIINQTFFNRNRINDIKLYLTDNVLYNAELYKVKNYNNESKSEHIPKYPVGTYRSVFYKKVDDIENLENYDKVVLNDRRNFNISNNKLVSMKNINIPANVNPMTYYNLIGKLDVLLYVDFNNDEAYLYPNKSAECFLNLFLPDQKINVLEKNDDYAIVNIIDFSIISNSFKNNNENIEMIKKWIDCNTKNIIVDNYELYYIIDDYNLYEWYYEKFWKIINDLFMYIEVYDIEAIVKDDLTKKIESNDIILDYVIEKCKCRILKEIPKRFNYVKWNDDYEWKNENDVTNKIYAKAFGTGILKITKKHFMNLTNSSHIDDNFIGELNDEQFKSLKKLNGPKISPFERFQYWTQFRLGSN